MVVKILIFSLFFILISLSAVSSGKTIFGKAKVIDGDTIHINKNKIRLHAMMPLKQIKHVIKIVKSGIVVWNQQSF